MRGGDGDEKREEKGRQDGEHGGEYRSRPITEPLAEETELRRGTGNRVYWREPIKAQLQGHSAANTETLIALLTLLTSLRNRPPGSQSK